MTDAIDSSAASRWRPTRLGLVNLYRYDDEVFRFADGRLLLRGNNGTGKTRVLALTLPFLLDGETRPARVEPDGDRNRRFEWHLLQDRYHERSGYCWLEFRRPTADGGERICTLGCGMRALQGHQGLRGRWFFVSEQPVGATLRLKRDDGTPWTRDELAQALEGCGTLYDQAGDYRRAVDDALFGLGEQRYRSLIDLLIELRRPQLSRQLDEAQLTRALSEALPPVATSVVDEVAENFQGLERDRDELAQARDGLGAVERFLAVYRDYLALQARRLADHLRQAQHRYEQAGRSLTQAEARRQAAEAAVAERQAEHDTLRAQARAAAAEDRALRSSEAMKTAEQLAQQQDRLAADRQRAAADAAAAASAQALAERAAERLAAAEQAVAAQQTATTTARQTLTELGQPLGAAATLAACPELAAEADHDALQADCASRRRAVDELARRDEARQAAARTLIAATERLQAAETAADAAAEACATAEERCSGARRELGQALAAHLRACRELLPVDLDALLEASAAWLAEPEGAEPVAVALAALADERRAKLATAAGRLQLALEDCGARDQALATEAAELERGVDPLPPPPPWRQGGARAEATGAPLWAVCDFADALDEAERAGLEAALQASQLLDAWITPDGSLRQAADGDALLLPQGPLASPALSELLQATPTPASGLDQTTIEAVLQRLGAAPDTGPAWVASDGRWALGPLAGRHTSDRARYLGAASRAAARAERLAAIAGLRQALAEERAWLQAQLAELDQRRQRLAAELALPSASPLRQAWQALGLARDRLGAATEALATAQAARQQAATAAETAESAARSAAAELGLADWLDDLPGLREQLAAYRLALQAWWHQVQDWRREAQLAEREAADHAALAEAQRRAAERARDSRQAVDSSARELAVLEETRGADVAELLERLAALQHQQDDLREREERCTQAIADGREEQGQARAAVVAAGERRDEADQVRAAACDRLRTAVAEELFAGLGSDWRAPLGADAADTRVLDLARRLAKDFAAVAVDERAADLLGTRMSQANQELQTALSVRNYQVQIEERHGIWEVRIPHAGRDCDVAELATRLRDDIAQRQLLLTQHEREVIENFLIDEACEALHRLLHDARHWIAEVNRELAERPMSTGLSLRFAHRVAEDAAAGTEEAVQRLLRPQHAWSPDDRAALASFLQQAIAQAREALPGHSWAEQLAVALDYRRWHRIGIERQQNGRWQRLTRRSHGTGSGGEKAIALTVPQFAAAAAHYRAAPSAPRLIMLDEAFVGIDTDMRRKCMGLLVAFDLDVVLTSEREWGCYDTVPALAIYQLASAGSGDTACIATTRYVWNGHDRQRDDSDGHDEAPPGTAETQIGQARNSAATGTPFTTSDTTDEQHG